MQIIIITQKKTSVRKAINDKETDDSPLWSISLWVLVQEYLDTTLSLTWRIFKSDILIAAENKTIYRKYWDLKNIWHDTGKLSLPFLFPVAKDCDDNEDKSCCTASHNSGCNHLVNYEDFVKLHTMLSHFINALYVCLLNVIKFINH